MTDRLEALRAKMAAARAATPAPTAQPSKLQQVAAATKTIVAQTADATPTPTAAESSLLRITEDMQALDKFDPQNFVLKLQAVRSGVESKAPGVATYLQEINRNLNQYPELVHLLSDEQIGVVVSGLLFMTNTNMIQATAAGKSKKPLSDTELDMMF